MATLKWPALSWNWKAGIGTGHRIYIGNCRLYVLTVVAWGEKDLF